MTAAGTEGYPLRLEIDTPHTEALRAQQAGVKYFPDPAARRLLYPAVSKTMG